MNVIPATANKSMLLARIACMKEQKDLIHNRIDELRERRATCCVLPSSSSSSSSEGVPPPDTILISGYFSQASQWGFIEPIWKDLTAFNKQSVYPPALEALGIFEVAHGTVYMGNIVGKVSRGAIEEDPKNPYYYVYEKSSGHYRLYGTNTSPVAAIVYSAMQTYVPDNQPVLCPTALGRDVGGSIGFTDWNYVCDFDCITACRPDMLKGVSNCGGFYNGVNQVFVKVNASTYPGPAPTSPLVYEASPPGAIPAGFPPMTKFYLINDNGLYKFVGIYSGTSVFEIATMAGYEPKDPPVYPQGVYTLSVAAQGIGGCASGTFTVSDYP